MYVQDRETLTMTGTAITTAGTFDETGTSDSSHAAARLLEMAVCNAAELLDEVKSEATMLVAKARADADQLSAASQADADQLTTSAKAEADQLVAAAESEAQAVYARLDEERAQTAAEIARLSQLEHEHRAVLRSHVTELLTQIDAPLAG